MGKRKIFGLLLALVMILSVVILPSEVSIATDQKIISILHTNDVHGNAEEDEDAGKLGYAKFKTLYY